MKEEKQSKPAGAGGQGVHDIADLFEGHFPGHTMQRVRTPDGKYRYSYVSPDVREAFGLDPDDLMQRDSVSHDWLHPDDRPGFVAALESSAKTLSVLDEEVRVEQSGGRFKWVRSIGHPRRLPDGTVIWDGVALDVTDRREALEALERALSQARREEISDRRFAAIAARDIAQPYDRLSRAIDRLRPIQDGDAGAPDQAAAVRNVVAAFDAYARIFDAARGVATAGREPGEAALEGGVTGSAAEGAAMNRLTRRQRDVLGLLRQGASNRDIARELGIGEGTVKLHVSAILRGLGVKNRAMVAALHTAPG